MKSGCPELEWVGVGGTWLQLMCCAVSHCSVPNFVLEIGDSEMTLSSKTVVRQR